MKKSKKKTGVKTVATPALVEASPRSLLNLDLGCGQNPREGFEGVDLYGDKAKHKVDLFKFPWPFADNSVDEINSSHFLEHIPAREVEGRDLVFPQGAADRTNVERFLGQDMLFAFMDECYRIMKVDAWMNVVVPSGRSSRAFWDPTHRRFFQQETFLYFNAEWRKLNSLDHYRANSNFAVECSWSCPNEEMLRAEPVRAERFNTLWNVTVDWIVKMKKLSPNVAPK